MRTALAFLSIGVTIVTVQSAPEPFPDEAKAQGWRMLDTHPRARVYGSWFTIEATDAVFRTMQQHYQPSSFAIWTKRLQQLRPGMTEEQVMQVLRPTGLAWRLLPYNDVILLNDAYFANVFFNEQTKRMTYATTPLAITYELKPALIAGLELGSASHVQAYRLAPLLDPHYRTDRRFRDAKLLSGPVKLSASDAALATREFQSIYSFGSAHDYCAFAPRYGFRFQIREGIVDVLISPHCHEVQIINDRGPDHVLRKTRWFNWNSQFTQMLKRLFPRYPLGDHET